MARVFTFGDHINTDLIIPARYLMSSDPAYLGQYCMEDADPDFASKVQAGDVIVAGENFGCGSSREHAALALKGAGVQAVIAPSFARIFFRNAINSGLSILTSPEAAAALAEGDTVDIDLASGIITRRSDGQSWQAEPLPPFMRSIIEAGGLLNYVKQVRT